MAEELRTVMPLIGSSFEPGQAKNTVKNIKDRELADIAQAELFYFSGQAEACSQAVEAYLESRDDSLRLSACLLYTFSNLTLGNIAAAQRGREGIEQMMKKTSGEEIPDEFRAFSVFFFFFNSVLLHIQPKGLPPMEEYSRYLSPGLRLYAVYVLAHRVYLNGDYERALGMAQSALMLLPDSYPIAMIYLYCIVSMCQINLKQTEASKESFMTAWKMAKADGFLEPFIEHHGLFQGVLESCIRKSEPQLYKDLMNGVIAFSRGWMKIHNPVTQKKVTALLSPMEFSVAMLACRDWTNQEIADHLGLSANTVKHYVSAILEKLHVDKRDKLKEYVNQ